MCKAFLGEGMDKLWMIPWVEKVMLGKTILEGSSDSGGHHVLDVWQDPDYVCGKYGNQ